MPTLQTSQGLQITDKNAAYYISVTGQGLMGALGLCAGFLYLKPANECATAPGCGLWLTNLTSETISTGTHFGVGMLSFGVINAYFSFDAIPRAMQYILKNKNLAAKIQLTIKQELSATSQTKRRVVEDEDEYDEKEEKSFQDLLYDLEAAASDLNDDESLLEVEPKRPLAKLASGTVVLGLTGVLTVQLLIVSLRRTPPAWQTFLTVAGGVPGSLYGTVGILENIIIPPLRKMLFELKKSRETNPDKLNTMEYHANNLQHLRLQVHANWRAIKLAQGRSELLVPIEKLKRPMHFLFEKEATVWPKSHCQTFYDTSLSVMAVGLAYCFTIPFLDSNTKYFQDNGVDNIEACYVIAVLLSSAQIYGNIQLAHHALSSFTDLVVNKSQAMPVDSLFYQLSPKLALLALLVDTMIASLSYSLVYDTAEEDYRGPAKDTFIYVAMVGIVIYHLGGLMEFVNLLFRRFNTDPHAKFMLEVEDAVDAFDKMSPEDLAILTESDADFRKMTGLNAYDEVFSPMQLDIPNLDSQNHLIAEQEKPASNWNCFAVLFKKKPAEEKDIPYDRYRENDSNLPKSDSEMARYDARYGFGNGF